MNATTAAAERPIGYTELIRRNRDFRFLWFGQIVSLLGDWFNLIASATLVAALTGCGLAVGGLFVVRMLAPFLLSPIAGVMADRHNRKRLLIASDLARGVTVLGFLMVRSEQLVWLLYALTAIQLGISSFFFTSRTAILPDLVSKRAIGTANALSSATWSIMLAVGAALGGLVAGIVGVYVAFLVDSMTFFISAALISRIRSQHGREEAHDGKSLGAAFTEYLDGLRYLRGHRDVLVLALHKSALTLCLGSTFRVVQVAISEGVFVLGKGGGIGMGLMFALAGVGTGLGPILARRFTGDRDRPLRLAILSGYLIGAAGLALSAPLWSFAAVLVGSLISGLGNGLLWVFSTQLLLHAVPGHIRGRVFASEFAMFTLASAVGAAVVGALLDTAIGISGVIWAMAALALLPAACWALWVVRHPSSEH